MSYLVVTLLLAALLGRGPNLYRTGNHCEAYGSLLRGGFRAISQKLAFKIPLSLRCCCLIFVVQREP
jgi:hypothetical protein